MKVKSIDKKQISCYNYLVLTEFEGLDKMIIDFHTHIFPDRMAQATISMLSEKAGFPNYLDARAQSLLESMKDSGIDKSVLLPALTAPKQFDSVNGYTLETSKASEGRLISFGGIHPDCEDIADKLKFLADSGFYGIKLHPDYQATFIDDEKYIKIITLAVKNGLAVTIHAGVDCGLPDPVHCTPERSCRMLERVFSATQGSDVRIVLAHMGGYMMGEDVLRLLCGANVYFDTGFTLFDKDLEMTLKIIKKHGADKILFATDSPWAPQKDYVEALKNCTLSDSDKRKIFSENAVKLLKI